MSPFRVGKRTAGEKNRREPATFTSAPPPAPTAPVRVPEVKKAPELPPELKEVLLDGSPGRSMRVEVRRQTPDDKPAVVTTSFKVNGFAFDKGDLLVAPVETLKGWRPFLRLPGVPG